MATITATPATPQTVPPAAPTPPTGTWQHPRLKEIEQRREAGIFTNTKLLHTVVFLGILVATFFSPGGWLRVLLSLTPLPATLTSLTITTLRLLLLFGASNALRPLWAPLDQMSDIPLTPTQRKLLGLTPSSSAAALASPSGTYITPPRYARSSTPRSDSSRAAVAGSSPLGPGTPFSGSPLARKAMEGRRFSNGSGFGTASGNGSPSLFEEAASASPKESVLGSPSGRGASVGLNSKWLYQRGKSRASGGLY